MYEQHFGLKKRLFRAKATGADVFVGPQTATTMAGIKKALTSSDAIASVSGPVGSGKTTLVIKALDSMAGQQKIVRVERIQLQSSDVLQLLLDELGIEDQPSGTIQKFNVFRRRLKEMEDCDTRLVIAVEDSPRLSVDTLAEIEALTAADSGVSDGANVILMGDEGLEGTLRDPQLSRLQQRIRQRLQTTPLCAAELRGYLRHCFRLAGSDFEQVFEPNAALLLHHLTGGIPRVANAVLESVMTAATEQGLNQVSSELLARIAEDEFDLSAAGFELTPVAAAEVPLAPVVEAIEGVSAAVEPSIDAAPEPAPETDEPVIVFADLPEPADLPELTKDTLPDLQILAPELAGTEAVTPSGPQVNDAEPDLATPTLAVDTPVLEVETPEPAVEAPVLEIETPEDVPAWDRDPTMAELRPDIEALEQAMAFTGTEEPKLKTAAAPERSDFKPEPMDSIPEITLDHAISQRIESKLIDEPGEVSPPQTSESFDDETKPELTALNIAANKPGKSDTDIQKIAEELSRATSLEDVDDRMAETLFGDELSLAASQFMKKAVLPESANDDLETVEINEEPVFANSKQQVVTAHSAASNPVSDNELDVAVTLDSEQLPETSGMELSASQCLKTVRALNTDLHPSLREPETTAVNDAPPIANEPTESIEDQINISMTQTLKALNVRPPVSGHDDDDDEQRGTSGFFSRFKRS